MQTFITKTIQEIISLHDSFEDVTIILPSQRSKVFVNQALKDHITHGFFPKVLNIEEFISEVSSIEKADSLELLFHFYTIYKKLTSNPDSFDIFSSWAITVIQDFNEIDQHLVDTDVLFSYIRDIQRLKKWSVEGTFKETELMKDHYRFLEELNKYYKAFYTFLKQNGFGYQGVLYREAVLNLDNYTSNNQNISFYFIGFNALNAAEEKIVQQLLHQGNTKVYWDIDKAFFNTNHQAAKFILKYKKHWPYYQKNEIETSDNFNKDKNIQLFAATKNISQIKYAGQILSELTNLQNSALVLADESLLPVALNSLPPNVEKLNITMGYPLKDIPTTQLIQLIFQLFLTQEKLNKSSENLFYYKSVESVVKHASIYKLLTSVANDIPENLTNRITETNLMFVSKEDIELAMQTHLLDQRIDFIIRLFDPYSDIQEFIQRIINLIEVLKQDVTAIEKEYLFRYKNAFIQLQNLDNKFGYFTDLKNLAKFFNELISTETLSFRGEPLSGLQLMGMLETRVLDFKNVILTSVNEGILPGNSQPNSFIPFEVKRQFKLPTYQEKDAIFSYHFFRLVQRAENVYIIYNTVNDNFGKGERSRFISQLELLKPHIQTTQLDLKVKSNSVINRVVTKDDSVLLTLKHLAQKGISPSALTTYLYNPLKFYQQKILKISELNEVEETIASNTMGTVIHEVLDDFYKPYIGSFITVEALKQMLLKTRKSLAVKFKKYFKNGDLQTGKNRLTYEVSVRFIENFLRQELELVSNNENQLKIIATEQSLSVTIKLEQLEFPIKLHGNVDRIDQLNGVTRIIDYKSGKVTSTDLKLPFIGDVIDYKYHKAIQVMLYAYMYMSQKDCSVNEIEAGVISFKNLNSGFLKMNFATRGKQDNIITKERLEEFIEELKSLLSEIYSKSVPFEEPLDLPF